MTDHIKDMYVHFIDEQVKYTFRQLSQSLKASLQAPTTLESELDDKDTVQRWMSLWLFKLLHVYCEWIPCTHCFVQLQHHW